MHKPKEAQSWRCPYDHAVNTGGFCTVCGRPRPEETPKKRRKKGWAIVLAVILLLVMGIAGWLFYGHFQPEAEDSGSLREFVSDREDAGKPEKPERGEVPKPTAPVPVETAPPEETPEEDSVYLFVLQTCEDLKKAGDLPEAVRFLQEWIGEGNDDPQYTQLLQEYETLLKEQVLADAREYARAEQYRLAIRTLDNACRDYAPYREWLELAEAYRREFGIWHTSYFSAGKYNTILIRDGVTAVAGDDTYGEQEGSGWEGVVSVSAGDRHLVALREDGTVLAAGETRYGQCVVNGWPGIAAISAGDVHTVVLKQDGTLAAAGFNDQGQCNVQALMDAAGNRSILSVAAGYQHTLALLEDGRVVACGSNSTYTGCCDVLHWTDIAAIYAGTSYSAGLKTDGTVVVSGENKAGQSVHTAWDLSGWTDLVSLSAGDYFLVGLRADGKVLSVGFTDQNALEEMASWENVVYVSAGNNHVVAMTAEGMLLCAGSNKEGQCNFRGAMVTYPSGRISE